MLKNVAGQDIGAQMITAADGTAFTSAVTVYVTVESGTQTIGSVGSGACTHEGNGYHSYQPATAETNGDHVSYTFIGTGAIPTTVQVFTDASYDRLGAPAGASVSADIAVIEGYTDDIGVAGAGLTNIGTIATVTNLTNLPTIPANWLTAAGTAADFTTEVVAGMNDLSAAEVAAELATYDGPTKTEMDSAFTEIKGATWAATDSLEAIRNQGDAAWTTATGFATNTKQDTMETTLNAAATASALATVDTVVDAVKVQTDKLTFTVANELDANIQSINDAPVTGDGTPGTEWDSGAV